jgi:uncharacterized FAD-dependent dehydrogenase
MHRLLAPLLLATATALLAPHTHRPPTKAQATYRLFDVVVAHGADPGAAAPSSQLSPALKAACKKRVRGSKTKAKLKRVTRVVRKSLDVRKKLPAPRWTYVVDVECAGDMAEQQGRCERLGVEPAAPAPGPPARKKSVVVVGSGPAGLFAALQLAADGCVVTLIERGEPVERRGRDIGRLMAGRQLQEQSNFCFGEGGAGTWSDGKLTTRIGRNSGDVRAVLRTFVRHGAPAEILTQGSPHLGTDGLVGILKSMRGQLHELGVDLRFGTRLLGLETENNECVGVRVLGDGGEATVRADAVVCAAGHSADDVYDALEAAGATLEAKPVAVGFRVEHPQALVNGLAYGQLAGRVVTGNARTDRANLVRHPSEEVLTRASSALLPVASYRLAADVGDHSCYSFCMCPGGQVVPAITKPSEMVVNGMSYSRRHSLFANAALVVSVSTDDPCLDHTKGARRVLEFQRSLERKAAMLGGGDYTCPVQRLTDFVDGRKPKPGPAPASSYRLGVREVSLHDDLLPDSLADALRAAATGDFERSMPGFVGEDAILHGVETRTSAPLRVVRDEGCESVSLKRLYPCGEGAGYAGGIVSAAVDGLRVARAVLGGECSDVGAATGVADPQEGVGVAVAAAY